LLGRRRFELHEHLIELFRSRGDVGAEFITAPVARAADREPWAILGS